MESQDIFVFIPVSFCLVVFGVFMNYNGVLVGLGVGLLIMTGLLMKILNMDDEKIIPNGSEFALQNNSKVSKN